MSITICQVVSHYVPAYEYGGPLRVAHALGRALVRAGHAVTVCTTNRAGHGQTLDVPIDQPVIVDGVEVYYEPTLWLNYWGYSPGLIKRSRKLIADADLVLVHAHYQHTSIVGAQLARELDKPYVVFAHGSLHRSGIDHKKGPVKRAYLRLLEKRNFESACFVAFNAPEEMAQSYYREYGAVLPSGIEPNDFAERPAIGTFRSAYPELQGKTMFLFLGRLDIKHKGLDLFLPAFARICRQNPGVHLVLAGPDEDKAAVQLRQMAKDLGVARQVSLTGLVTGETKVAALQDADVFVLPSRFEGLSIALLEALYFGLPVLVTDRVGLHESVRALGAGIVADPAADALEAGLLPFLDSELRRRMRNRATGWIADNYTWDAIANELINMCQPWLKTKDIGLVKQVFSNGN